MKILNIGTQNNLNEIKAEYFLDLINTIKHQI